MDDTAKGNAFSRDMKKQRRTLPIDLSLTSQNAQERGYMWVEDVVYTDDSSAFKEIEALLKDGYKLGSPHDPVTSKDKGLYRPLADLPLSNA